MADGNVDGLGWRERKTLATRRALSEAALSLAAERGLENVLVGDIAAAVGVSTRTFNNYFGSKHEAIVGVVAAQAAALSDAICSCPVDLPVWDAIAKGVAAHVPQAVPEKWKNYVRFIRDTPALEAEQLRAYAVLERSLAVEIAMRTGTDVHKDLYPRLAACVVIGAMRATLHHWLDATEEVPYSDLLQRLIRQIGLGLPAPVPRALA
jgi:AcrR family transcriptional regulator